MTPRLKSHWLSPFLEEAKCEFVTSLAEEEIKSWPTTF